MPTSSSSSINPPARRGGDVARATTPASARSGARSTGEGNRSGRGTADGEAARRDRLRLKFIRGTADLTIGCRGGARYRVRGPSPTSRTLPAGFGWNRHSYLDERLALSLARVDP